MLSKISYLRGNLVGMLRVTVKVGVKVVKDNIIEWVGIGFKLSPPFFDW
jgi:hypothetical protein